MIKAKRVDVMKRVPDENAAGICGLYCGTCPSYPDDCHGCYSDKVRSNCVECMPGFRTCTKERGIRYCFECTDFPCQRVLDFSKMHIVNGICHHENIINDLNEMKKIGVKAWVDKQTAENTCPKCGELMWWCEKPHVCKK